MGYPRLKMRVTVVSVKEPSGKPLAAMKKLGILITVDCGLEDLNVLQQLA
jgi:hypothetical protein